DRSDEASGLVRDRQFQQVLAEDDDEVVVGITRGAGTADAREGTAQRRQQAQVVKPPEAVHGQPPELCEDPLFGRPRNERRVSANELFGFGNEPEVERQLVLEAWAPQQPERIVAEDGLGDGAETPRGEIVVAPKRVHALAGARALCDRVDAEIAGREIVLDRPGQRREIDRAPVGQRHSPRSVALGERKGSAPGRPGIARSSLLRLPDRDVDVHDRPFERLVANRATYDPRLLAGEQLLDQLTNRRPPASNER